MPQVSLKDAGRSQILRNVGSVSVVNTDLHLVCRDGVVNTHQALFSWASGFLRRIFMSQLILEDGGKRKEDVTLHVPDFSVKVITAVTNFLMLGQINVKGNKSFQENFEEAWEAFRIDRITFKEVFDAGNQNRRTLGPPNQQIQSNNDTPARRPLRAVRSRSSTSSVGASDSESSIQHLGSKLNTNQKLKNPFNKLRQNLAVSRTGPPGPPGLAVSSPVVSNRSKKLPLSFLKKNQSLLFKSPKFSSTPIRPFTKTNTSSALPEKLFNNSEVSITLSSEHGAPGSLKVGTLDEDMPVIVEEVSGDTIDGQVGIKDELPKGISITKQTVPPPIKQTVPLPIKPTLTGTSKPSVKTVKKSLPQAKLPAYVKKMTVKGHKKMIGSKLKKKELKKKAFPVDKSKVVTKKPIDKHSSINDVSTRRTSARLSSGTIQTYNEEIIESNVFEKKQESSKVKAKPLKEESKSDTNTRVESIDKTKVMNSTKKLTIPLKKVEKGKLNMETASVSSKAKVQPTTMDADSETKSAPGNSTVKITKHVTNPKPQASIKTDDAVKDVTEKLNIPGSSKDITVSITKSTAPVVADPDLEVLTCYVCNQTKDKEQRHLNLKNIFYVRSHISKCLYNAGKLFKAIPPGKENSDEKGFPIDEFGLKNGVWYNCEVEGCWLAQKKGVAGQVCYKVYAIHMASQHGALEMVMLEDGDKARELVEKLMDFEEKKKKESISKTISTISIVKMEKPSVTVEESSNIAEMKVDLKPPKPLKPSIATPFHLATPAKLVVARKSAPPPTPKSSPASLFGKDGLHNCFLCRGSNRNGTNIKDGQGLSFKDIPRLKEHYSKCLYNESKYVKFVPPGDHNSDQMGNPVDELGVGYRCEIKGCWLQKKVGDQGKVCYKVLALHMASQHGVLEKLLETDTRPFMKELLKRLKAAGQTKNAIVGCRFQECSKLQFKADNTREIKLHYAGTHFSDWFQVNPDTGVPDNFTKTGTRAVCGACTGTSNKPVYIQGEREAIRGHQVVKHDMLADVLIQAGETVKEAREVISDLYPERLADVYMDTLDKHTLPLNEDFMSKITL